MNTNKSHGNMCSSSIVNYLMAHKHTMAAPGRTTSPLASVQRLHDLKPIPRSEHLLAGRVLEFRVVVNKNDGYDSGLCVFFEPDAKLDPNNAAFAFLDKQQRVVKRTKVYGILSEGLCMPLTILSAYGLNPAAVVERQDVTAALKVTKHVSAQEAVQYKRPSGLKERIEFPTHLVPKTDEPNIQSKPEFRMLALDYFEAIRDRTLDVTVKMDGCSATYTCEGHICGRNFVWTKRDTSDAVYFEMNDKYHILDTIKGSGYSVQGEIVGRSLPTAKNPKGATINGNRMGLEDTRFLVFNIFSSESNSYVSHAKVVQLCDEWKLETVPSLFTAAKICDIEASIGRRLQSVEDWLDYADTMMYANGAPAEGIVVKTADGAAPRISFKVLSRTYKPC